jgi:hypothetical protein
LIFLALSSVAARPYEDTRRRFRLELPEKWELVPQFGDTSGMTFRRVLKTRHGDVPAILLIHVDSVPAADAREYADAVEAQLKKQAGFTRLEEREGLVGGKPALIRDYKMLASKKPKIEKQVRTHYIDAAAHHYLLHFETTALEFHLVEKDLQQILDSFRPIAGASQKKEAHAPIASDSAKAIAGRWVNDDELVLVLGDDGSFALAEASGRYEVEGGKLTMIIPGQGRESFTFIHDPEQRTLTLSSENLGKPMVYRRSGRASSAKKVKTTPATEEQKRSTEQAEKINLAQLTLLVGRWTTPTQNGALVLDLRADGAYSMGSMKGRWSATPEQLTLAKNATERIEYKFRFDASRLMLSGGDLDEEVAFSRSPSP